MKHYWMKIAALGFALSVFSTIFSSRAMAEEYAVNCTGDARNPVDASAERLAGNNWKEMQWL